MNELFTEIRETVKTSVADARDTDEDDKENPDEGKEEGAIQNEEYAINVAKEQEYFD